MKQKLLKVMLIAGAISSASACGIPESDEPTPPAAAATGSDAVFLQSLADQDFYYEDARRLTDEAQSLCDLLTSGFTPLDVMLATTDGGMPEEQASIFYVASTTAYCPEFMLST